ncbi:hypothetical protein VTN00DRAFT_3349 [Thermoascus crustaceus]|uniref:uncharacterized protein n=1 Tax=Thermoascus crustaceus TaxID=5088 RepID=UPI0037441F80
MRILHYPEQTETVDDQNGIGAHTDFECFTIVNQDDCGGLEVLSKSGDWTNDFFVSTIHRVVNKSGRERYSSADFWGFDRSKLLEPVLTGVRRIR